MGFIAYTAGAASHAVATTGGDGRIYYYGHDGFGFFPFFGLFWILLIGFLFFRFAFWRPWGGGYGRGYWHQHPHEHTDTTTNPQSGQTNQQASA